MTRGRRRIFGVIRLAIYLAAALLVARPPALRPAEARITIARSSEDPRKDPAPDLLAAALMVVLVSGILLEIRAGAVRWR